MATMNLLRAGRVYSLYDVCERVAQQVLEEPKRLDMSWWVCVFKNNKQPYASQAAPSVVAQRQGTGPACGTVACLAGWMGLNMRMEPTRLRGSAVLKTFNRNLAYGAFGQYSPNSVWDDLDDLFSDVNSPHRYGTRAYARYYATRLRKLMKKHRADMQFYRIKITTTGPVPVTEA